MDNFNKGLWTRVGDVYKILYNRYTWRMQTRVEKLEYGGVIIHLYKIEELGDSIIKELTYYFEKYKKYRFLIGVTPVQNNLYIKID